MRMRVNVVVAVLVGSALCAFAVAGCDDAQASSLEGTWVRTRTIGPESSTPDSDTWTLTLRADGTFTMRHVHLESGVFASSDFDSTREGEYEVDGDGRISFSGGWLDGATEVTSLEDLGASYKTLSQSSMYLLDDTEKALFIGPDFDFDSAYTIGNSYDILFPSSENTFFRESSLVLTGADGTVVEQRIEKVTYTLVDTSSCTIDYSYSTAAPENTEQGVVPASSCAYEYSEGQEIEGLDGARVVVPMINFAYTLNGEPVTDNFAMFDGVLISYTPSLLDGVIADNVFVKSAD